MYTFAIVALSALAIVKVVDLLADLVPALDRGRSLLTFVLAMGAMWRLDFSMFDSWGVSTRDHAIAVLGTGLVVAGMTTAWRAVFGWLTHDHATRDETLGEHGHLRTVA